MKTYYHGLKISIEEEISEFTDIVCYDNNSTCSLLEFWHPKTGLCVKQFLQILINTGDNIHIFLALKDMSDYVIVHTLWTLDDINEQIGKF